MHTYLDIKSDYELRDAVDKDFLKEIEGLDGEELYSRFSGGDCYLVDERDFVMDLDEIRWEIDDNDYDWEDMIGKDLCRKVLEEAELTEPEYETIYSYWHDREIEKEPNEYWPALHIDKATDPNGKPVYVTFMVKGSSWEGICIYDEHLFFRKVDLDAYLAELKLVSGY